MSEETPIYEVTVYGCDAKYVLRNLYRGSEEFRRLFNRWYLGYESSERFDEFYILREPNVIISCLEGCFLHIEIIWQFSDGRMVRGLWLEKNGKKSCL